MSCKVYTPEQEAQIDLAVWLPKGAVLAHPRRDNGTQPGARRITDHAESSNMGTDENHERHLQARLDAARREGFAAGEAKGLEIARQRFDPEIKSLANLIGELSKIRSQFRREAEQATVNLAIAIARRILNREMSADPDAILGLVKAAFQKCDARETFRLRVTKEDATLIEGHRERLRLPRSLEIEADRTLSRGSAIFETRSGDLDVSVDTQLAEIERGFADILKQRNA